ncbi:MAG: hypothetical protein LH465_04770 [Sphingomonas bacterium]|nr:hypothetical protein [Sphingomonas bacterium]
MAKAMWMAMAVMLPATASAQVALVRPNVVQAIGPKQDDPLTCGSEVGGGGVEAIGPKQDDPRQGIIVQGGRQLAIGPKQDDPRSPGVSVVGTYDPDTDPQALKAIQGKCGKAKL